MICQICKKQVDKLRILAIDKPFRENLYVCYDCYEKAQKDGKITNFEQKRV